LIMATPQQWFVYYTGFGERPEEPQWRVRTLRDWIEGFAALLVGVGATWIVSGFDFCARSLIFFDCQSMNQPEARWCVYLDPMFHRAAEIQNVNQ
jgi:hypothetical protein